MDISLNSSAILVIIVGLWLVWVVPYFLRRPEGMPAQQFAARSLPAVTSPSYIEDSSSQGNILENTSKPTSSNPAASATAPAAGEGRQVPEQSQAEIRTHKAPKPFKIRYGRTALAGFGAAALLAGVVCAIISMAGLIPAYIPVIALVAAVGSVAALRALAVRDRTKRSEQRIEAAFRDAMSPGPAPRYDTAGTSDYSERAGESPVSAQSAAAASKRETKLFDAENPSNDGSGSGADPAQEGPQMATSAAGTTSAQQLTAGDLRQAALAVAAESNDQAKGPVEGSGGSPAEDKRTWEPVHVPKPTYVDSAKAERPAPEPLEMPAEPKPEGKPSIKAGAVAPKVEMKLDQEAVEQTAHKGQTPAAGVADHEAELQAPSGKVKPSGGLHDLDNVLQRRRA